MSKSIPFVCRQTARADADAARGADVEAGPVDAAPLRRLKGARHVARAHAVHLEQGAPEAHVQVAHEDALGRGEKVCCMPPPRFSRAKRSSSSGRRTGASPHTVKIQIRKQPPAGQSTMQLFRTRGRSKLGSSRRRAVSGRSRQCNLFRTEGKIQIRKQPPAYDFFFGRDLQKLKGGSMTLHEFSGKL